LIEIDNNVVSTWQISCHKRFGRIIRIDPKVGWGTTEKFKIGGQKKLIFKIIGPKFKIFKIS
jgi:hypothetical protein